MPLRPGPITGRRLHRPLLLALDLRSSNPPPILPPTQLLQHPTTLATDRHGLITDLSRSVLDLCKSAAKFCSWRRTHGRRHLLFVPSYGRVTPAADAAL